MLIGHIAHRCRHYKTTHLLMIALLIKECGNRHRFILPGWQHNRAVGSDGEENHEFAP